MGYLRDKLDDHGHRAREIHLRRETRNETAPMIRPDDWYEHLRQRFVDVAKRRVPEPDVDDVVQEALRIVYEKGVGADDSDVEGWPPVAWCFRVLRNVIGNHYRRRRTRRRFVEPDAAVEDVPDSSSPLEALASAQAVTIIRQALDRMAEEDAPCGRYLARVLSGAAPNIVASEEGLEEAVFYRRLYRCRQKLRALLAKRGVRP